MAGLQNGRIWAPLRDQIAIRGWPANYREVIRYPTQLCGDRARVSRVIETMQPIMEKRSPSKRCPAGFVLFLLAVRLKPDATDCKLLLPVLPIPPVPPVPPFPPYRS